jgi:CPA2 family monovalent cation:H+ antiporter-2
VLVQAHIARARLLLIATPDTLGVRRMAATARLLNPAIEIVVRSHNQAEARLLEAELSGKVFLGERELALAMTRYVIERCRQADSGNHGSMRTIDPTTDQGHP